MCGVGALGARPVRPRTRGLGQRVGSARPAPADPRVRVPGDGGQWQRRAQPGRPQRHQLGQHGAGLVRRQRSDRGAGDAEPLAPPDRDRLPRLAGGRGERHQPGPRPDPLLRGEPGVLDAQGRVPVQAAHGADDAGAVGKLHVDVPVGGLADAVLGGRRHQGLDVLQHGGEQPVAECAGWQVAAAPLGLPTAVKVAAREPVGQHPVPDRPRGEAIRRDRQRVGWRLVPREQRQPHPLGEEPLDRVLQERDQVVERHEAGRCAGERGGEERWRCGPRPGGGAGPGQLGPVEAERCRRGEVAPVERLQRMPDHDIGLRRGGGDGVEQLAERHRGRAAQPGALVGARVDDDERVGGRHDRVEEELAVFAARVALADQRTPGQHVVAVDLARAGEDAVVQPEEADDAVRHRAHRHERGHGERAGAEARAGGAPAQALGEQAADIGEAERHRRGVRPRDVRRLRQLGARLDRLPRVGGGGGREQLEGGGERGRPLLQRPLARQLPEHARQALDELGQPSDADGVGRLDRGGRARCPATRRRASRRPAAADRALPPRCSGRTPPA